MRLGWCKPVHVKTLLPQEVRALLTARKLLVEKLRGVDNSLRGILRGFSLKVGRVGNLANLPLVGNIHALNVRWGEEKCKSSTNQTWM